MAIGENPSEPLIALDELRVVLCRDVSLRSGSLWCHPLRPGATTGPRTKMSGSQAAGNARLAAVQFRCDSSTNCHGLMAAPGVSSGSDEMQDQGTRSYRSHLAVILDNSHRTSSQPLSARRLIRSLSAADSEQRRHDWTGRRTSRVESVLLHDCCRRRRY